MIAVPAERVAAGMARTFEAQASRHRITHSRYRLVGDGKPLGFTELTTAYRPDGSRTFLARERMEFWGPVLDRFVVLSFDPQGRFDSGHWVGTSRYSPAFRYTFRFDGLAIRADWEDDVRGRGWADVPSSPGEPVIGFWGPLESLVLERFDRDGPAEQMFDAIDVEDSHHRRVRVSARRVGRETIDVPAGRLVTTHYRTERFGLTDHWLDDDGTVIRWSAEGGAYNWDLERAPAETPPGRSGRVIASGEYTVTPGDAGTLRGTLSWRIAARDDGTFAIVADERLAARESHFDGALDARWNWTAASETTRWIAGEGAAGPELHYQELFFFRDRLHVVRLRDTASPLVQSRTVRAPVRFLPVNYPVAALAFLARAGASRAADTTLPELAHIANRYRGNGLEVQEARLKDGGAANVDVAGARVPAHRWTISYDGGWGDSTIELTVDERAVPLVVRVSATDGPVTYQATRVEVTEPVWLPSRGDGPPEGGGPLDRVERPH